MKSSITILFLMACAALHAQDQYLLIPMNNPGKVEFNEPDAVRRITAQFNKMNKLQGGIEGYRIQIYIGQNRGQAQEIIDEFTEAYEGVPANIVFDNPNVKVHIGTFRDKLEAEKFYRRLKSEYESVVIVKVRGMPYPSLDKYDFEQEEEE